MDLTGLERPLNYLELAHLDRVVIMAAEYEGDLDADVLADAFQHLCAVHPVLRARVRGTSPEAVLAVSPEHEPEVVVLDDGPDALAKIAGLPWDATAGVADLVLVQGDGHGYVALRTDHSITDANAWLGTFRELLRVFTAFASGEEPVCEPGTALPAPPAALFHERLGLIQPSRTIGMVWRNTSPIAKQLLRISEVAGEEDHRAGRGMADALQIVFGERGADDIHHHRPGWQP